jgi:hypothetical protein
MLVCEHLTKQTQHFQHIRTPWTYEYLFGLMHTFLLLMQGSRMFVPQNGYLRRMLCL